MYGRIAVVHHEDPYLKRPAVFIHDPFLQRMGAIWRDQRSLYGPGFTLLSDGVVAVAGDSPWASRFGFQLLAALAAFGAVLVIGWATGDVLAMAFIGLNPFVVVTVVNGGHNDALAALVVLVGILLARRERDVLAGLSMALAVLIKVVGVVPMGMLAAWTWRRRGPGAAARQLGTGIAVGVAAYWIAGVAAVRDLRNAFHLGSPFSTWKLPLHVTRLVHRYDPTVSLAGMVRAYRYQGIVALLAMVVVIAVVGLPRLADSSPAVAVGSVILTYALMAAYVQPWFVFLGMPVLALAWQRLPAWAAVVDGAALTFGYLLTQHFRLTGNNPGVLWIVAATSASELVLIVVLVAWSVRAKGDPTSESAESAATPV
jgi:alpha-1,6-mannosyltransferase